MKLTKEQAESLYQAWYKADGHHAEMESVITKWESIRPPCGECEKLREGIAELNQRLHDWTQAFLGKAGRAGR